MTREITARYVLKQMGLHRDGILIHKRSHYKNEVLIVARVLFTIVRKM